MRLVSIAIAKRSAEPDAPTQRLTAGENSAGVPVAHRDLNGAFAATYVHRDRRRRLDAWISPTRDSAGRAEHAGLAATSADLERVVDAEDSHRLQHWSRSLETRVKTAIPQLATEAHAPAPHRMIGKPSAGVDPARRHLHRTCDA